MAGSARPSSGEGMTHGAAEDLLQRPAAARSSLLALARGKNAADKRQTEKDRDWAREKRPAAEGSGLIGQPFRRIFSPGLGGYGAVSGGFALRVDGHRQRCGGDVCAVRGSPGSTSTASPRRPGAC